MKTDTKDNSHQHDRNYPGTGHAEPYKIYTKQQSDQPAALHHRAIAGEPSPQQDGQHSDTHRRAQGIGIAPDTFTQTDITERGAVECYLTPPEHTREEASFPAENGQASTRSTIKKNKEQA